MEEKPTSDKIIKYNWICTKQTHFYDNDESIERTELIKIMYSNYQEK
jgi:hypothetical protein